MLPIPLFILNVTAEQCWFSCYLHYSVALAVDNPELFGRIAETFCSRAAIRFVVLLWGEKSCLPSEVMDRVPVFNYKEIIDLGRECRSVFLDSHYASKSIYSMLILYDITKFITMGIENHITNLAMWQKFEFWKFGKYGMWTIGINNWKHENQKERKKMRTQRGRHWNCWKYIEKERKMKTWKKRENENTENEQKVMWLKMRERERDENTENREIWKRKHGERSRSAFEVNKKS